MLVEHLAGDEAMTAAIRYGKGGPARRRRKDDPVEVPPGFDLDLVNKSEPIYLPGGLMRALEDACRLQHHPLRGVHWPLAGADVFPGKWVLLADSETALWALVYSSGVEDMIVVCRGGGYRLLDKPMADRYVQEVADTPPWWEEMACELIELDE